MMSKKMVGLLALAALCIWVSTSVAQIATGPNAAADGYLSIGVDSFGGWADAGFGGGGDSFKPTGFSASAAAFTSGFFLFVDGNKRELLSSSGNWQSTFPADASLTSSISSSSAFSDSNSDGVNDTAISAFQVADGTGGIILDFRLRQRVVAVSPGVSVLRQDYFVVNSGTNGVAMEMVRAFDGDLPWTGGANFFNNDEVGTGTNGSPFPGTYVFEQEPDAPGVTAVTISGLSHTGAYYGGKNGVAPTGGPPNFAFGTDVQVWDAFGVPATWANEIANVGNGVDGVSGASPGTDGFVGLQFFAELGPGQSDTITVYHTYGSNLPVVPEPAAGLMAVMAGLATLRLRRRS